MSCLLGWGLLSATIPSSQVGKLGIQEVAMTARPYDVAARLLLTSRRHIDFGRTSSAICRPV
ncbi:hypothetical protein GCM10018789_61020 [Streptomyces werraensis]|nr:hypothetical protein GCM10018789_61020 [Streptomyces werraensis]